jgi:hypothetical protein
VTYDQSTKRVCVLTMIGGVDVIGELAKPPYGQATLTHPCLMQRNGATVGITPILGATNILSGDSVDINMATVMWVSEPSSVLLAAWESNRSGIIRPSALVSAGSEASQ